MPETLATMFDKERERLRKALEDLGAKQEELEAQRATIETELDALDTYEAARSGTARKSRTGSRAPRGSRQQSVLAIIAKSKKGMTRGDILQAMEGDKAGERAVSNALTALKKAKRVTSKDRKYQAA
jgi:hypothetical protein